ncbi:2-oxoglutarate dehydrogenase E1 component [Psittacicella melopsittaci]|nr:2-oxoglutarate dehydrogenase E1 component [Psittacicella melopsittaci]
MWRKSLEEWLSTTSLSGFNQLYIEQLYEQYASDPSSVDANWAQLFHDLEESSQVTKSRYYVNTSGHENISCANLIETYRNYGHLIAQIDPLNLWKRNQSTPFNLIDFNLHPEQDVTLLVPFAGQKKYKVLDLYVKLRYIYASTIGYEFSHISNLATKEWLTKAIELYEHENTYVDKIRMLNRLVRAEQFEIVLNNKYPGAKRFSLEGTESLVVLLDNLFNLSGDNNLRDIIVGMAHRGRLNVLANHFGMQMQEIYDLFAGKHELDSSFAGDVKYHYGRSAIFTKTSQASSTRNKLVENKYVNYLNAHLMYNPSHLEFVSSVVMGAARAKISAYNKEEKLDEYTNRGDFGVSKGTDYVLPIYIHGDSAVAGQGIVQETLNMSNTRGYSVGGGIHIVLNNQIGFTTNNLKDVRSSTYASDIAKAIDAPIFHVNAEDLDAISKVAYLAFKYRQRYKKDVFIDLVGYRRQGHNEADDPTVTQPKLYQLIKEKELISSIYAKSLEQQGVIEADYLDSIRKKYYKEYNSATETLEINNLKFSKNEDYQKGFHKHTKLVHKDDFKLTEYARLSNRELKDLGKELCYVPDSFELSNTVARMYNLRNESLDTDAKLQWGQVELLAYATLMQQGKNIRLSGEDVGRGTFFHRAAVLCSFNKTNDYIPLLKLAKDYNTKFEIWDSTLTECGVLGFEYGYSISEPNSLVIWEAQFGDFANGAQPIIDQFIVSGETKWNQVSGLTLLLPHGYEGQGAEHSSGRVERFLQLCADNNMRVVIPTEAKNMYHLLVNQGLSEYKKPLVVFTPKSLLRLDNASASINDITSSKFETVIYDSKKPSDKIEKLIITSGRIRYDVEQKLKELDKSEIYHLHLEQLYPFPEKEIKKVIDKMKNLTLVEIVQDEPENQGYWNFALPYIINLIKDRIGKVHIGYNGRKASATTATGYPKTSKEELEQILAKLDSLNNFFI